MLRTLTLFVCLLFAPWLATGAWAQSGVETFGDYQVHYSVFNSTFVQPEVASTYGINRARNRSLVNVSVMRTQEGRTSLGQSARVVGHSTNLLQQQQTLDFREVSDGTATYYIASMRHIDEEMHNFRIEIQPEGSEQSYELRFSQKLYLDR